MPANEMTVTVLMDAGLTLGVIEESCQDLIELFTALSPKTSPMFLELSSRAIESTVARVVEFDLLNR